MSGWDARRTRGCADELALARRDDADSDLPALPLADGIAEDLERARPGQPMLIGADGAVIGPRSDAAVALRRRWQALYYGSVLGSVFVGTLLFGVPAGVLVGCGIVGGFMVRLRSQLALVRVLRQLATGEHAAVETTALKITRSFTAGAVVRANAWYVAGVASWLRGNLSQALAYTRRGIEELAALPTKAVRGVEVLARINEIQILAILRRDAEARALLGRLAREGVPTGDLVRMQLVDTRLVLAFEAGDASELPADLDEWTQSVLRTNRFGSTLVLLAWAHVQRGDGEMAETLLDVASDRLPECCIELAHPRLAAWLASARAS